MTGDGNWTYLLAGRQPVLIDAGVGQASHVDTIAHHAADELRSVLVTHAHGDHISGVSALAARWPAARFEKFPWPDRDAQHQVPWHRLADGDCVTAGDTELTVIHTPGHAPDHVAFWQEATGTLFSGDLLVAGSTVVIQASSGGSLADYLRSLERIRALRPRRLLPAHGAAIDNPDRLIAHYLEHRRQREAQVMAGLRAGRRQIEVLVADIYPGLAPALLPMARETVLAHLVKLADEGRARRDGDDWTII